MSWAEFDTDEWPVVKVKLNNRLDEAGWEKFKTDWLSLYNHSEPFTLLFDTSQVGWVSMKYAFLMADFIEVLRMQEKFHGYQLLKESFIFYDSWYIKFLLKLIFQINTPVAPVHILPKSKFNITQYKEKNISK